MEHPPSPRLELDLVSVFWLPLLQEEAEQGLGGEGQPWVSPPVSLRDMGPALPCSWPGMASAALAGPVSPLAHSTAGAREAAPSSSATQKSRAEKHQEKQEGQKMKAGTSFSRQGKK